MNKFLLTATAATLLSACVVACSDDDDEVSFKAEDTFHYNMNISSEVGVSQSLLLDSLSGDISGIVNAPRWTEITQGESEDGHPVINVKVVSEGTVNKSQNAEVTVTVGTQRAIVNLKQEAIFMPNANGNEDFEKDWETMSSVTLYNSSSSDATVEANLPWADASVNNLPDAIIKNYKKEHGWEMAFNTTGTKGMNRANYFGLYNRYSGILRVYYYISEAATDASEYNFTVQLGGVSGSAFKQPFAHTLRYGVPNDRFGVIDNATNFYGDKLSNRSFQSIIVPYRNNQNTAMSVGWTAFDIDMSGYTPYDVDWKTAKTERLAIAVNTLKSSSITLAGTLNQQAYEMSAGDSKGTQEVEFFENFSISDVVGGVKEIIEAATQSADGLFGIIGKYKALYTAGLKVGTIFYDLFTHKDEVLNPVDPTPTKVEKWFTEGKIDLSGYISNFASNNCTPLSLSCNGNIFKKDSHVGTGVWNLASSPVVYLASDHVMGSLNRFSLQAQGNKKCFNSNSESLALRLVAFLDPTSFQFNINGNAFKYKSVEVIQYDFGVYPNADKGSTAEYERWLQVSRPDVALYSKEDTVTINQTSLEPQYHLLMPDRFLSAMWGETPDNSKKYTRKDSNISYYGQLVTDGQNHEMDYIPNPQIYFPCDGNYIENGVGNDLVVNVLFRIVLEDGTALIFSQRFLPEVKLISGKALEDKYAALCQYSDDCANGKAVGKTNDGVAVYHLTGNQCIDKPMQILKAILNK